MTSPGDGATDPAAPATPTAPSAPTAPASAAAPAAPATGMRWWGRLLLVVTAEALLFGSYLLEARPATFDHRSPPWPVWVLMAFLLVVVIQGSGRLPTWAHAGVWIAGSLAAVAGVWAAVPVYVATVGTPRTATVVTAVRDSAGPRLSGSAADRARAATTVYSVASVRLDGDDRTRPAYLLGDWSQSIGRTTEVREDPLHLAGLQSAAPVGPLQIFWLVLWIPAFVVLQAGLLAVLLRRGPNLVATAGGS